MGWGGERKKKKKRETSGKIKLSEHWIQRATGLELTILNYRVQAVTVNFFKL